MRIKIFSAVSLLVITCLMIAATAMAEPQKLEGYYNLDQYEELTGKKIQQFNEAPILKERVKAGELPPVSERLPKNPLVMIPWGEVGKYGGELRWDEFTIDYDHFLRHINSAELLEDPFSAGLYYGGIMANRTQPGILSFWEAGPEAKVYTFKIREGLKWSDGEPVTTEDVKYCIEDVLRNKELIPVTPEWLRWGGKPTELKIIDEYTFQLVFAKPYGVFIEQMVRENGWGQFLRPKHWLKQFHKKYTSWDELMPKMKAMGYTKQEEWPNFYLDMEIPWADGGAWIRLAKPKEYPTLNPYVVKEVRENGDWILERNPYFYMVDTAGNQLPYIDRLHRQYVSNLEMVDMDIIQGKTDLQCQFIELSNYPVYKKNEEKGGYRVLPLKAWQAQMLIYLFNLAVDNEVFPTEIIQDIRFRQALSLALDRDQIRKSVFLDFGRPAQVAPLPSDPAYEEWMEKSYADYDPEKAKALLDEMGIRDTDGDGWREGPDGQPLIIPILYYKVTPPATPGAEMAKRYWEAIGLKVDAKQVNGRYLWQVQAANKLFCSVWWLGGASALGRSDFLAPFGVTMPEWRKWFNTNGEQGIEPLPWAKEMWEARQALLAATTQEGKVKYSKKIWELQAKYIPLIGTVVDTPIPFVYNKNLANIAVESVTEYTTTQVMEAIYQWYFKQ